MLLECQFRRASQLLGLFSEEETLNLQEATGNCKLSNSISCSLLPQGLQPSTIREEFEKLESRRLRILQTLLSERCYLWSCAEYLLHIFFLNLDEKEDEKNVNNKEGIGAPWLVEQANNFAQFLYSTGSEALILEYINAIRNSLETLRKGCSLFKENGGQNELEEDWIETQVIEAIFSMKIIWHFLLYTIETPSSQFVLEWFRLLESNDFFDQTSTVYLLFSSKPNDY